MFSRMEAMSGMPGEKPVVESLGTQFMEGVAVEGTRTTLTIPAGQIGNEQPINIVSERWFSPDLKVLVMSRQSDPRFGETTYRLTNITRAEPSPQLFEIPADFTSRRTRMAKREDDHRDERWRSRKVDYAVACRNPASSGETRRSLGEGAHYAWRGAPSWACGAESASGRHRADAAPQVCAALPLSLPGRLPVSVLRAPLGVRFRPLPLLGLARANLGDPLRMRHLQPLLGSRGVIEIGHGHARQPLVDRALDVADAPFVFGRHERKRRAGQLGARRASDAMDVILRRGRHVEVDDVPERRHIDAARRDVGGDEHPIFSALEAGERFGALRLRPIAVNALHAHLVLLEVLGQPIGAMLRAREHERFLHVSLVQQREQQALLQMRRHRIDGVRDARRRQRPSARG